MADLDDAFADFLKEVEDVSEGSFDSKVAPSAEPQQKKARHAVNMSRSERAEMLRKAAYLGNSASVDNALGPLPVAERLLLIDDLDEEDGFAALHLATIRGHEATLKRLIAFRADVDLPTRDGDTPLMWAAHMGKIDICKELLRAGADALVTNKTKTAISEAKMAGHRRIHDLLENHAFDAVAGLKHRARSLEKAAEARRAANLAMLERSAREAKEKQEEDAFWAAIRARQQNREARGENVDFAARAECAAASAEAARAQPTHAAEEEVVLSNLPLKMHVHYKMLKLTADATEADARKAYRLLALRHHPDKNPDDPVGAKERFTKLAITYEAVCEFLATSPATSRGAGARVAPPRNY